MNPATIQTIKEIRIHPNADSLEIARVLNYDCIIKKGLFVIGEKIVFIMPDSVLPDKPWAAIYRAKSNRIRAIRLRQVWSEGLIEKLSTFDLSETIDGDVSSLLEIAHYEPPAPQDLSAKGNLPFGISKTDEESFGSIVEIPFGQVVDVTLKIDGSSETFYCKIIDGVPNLGITSRSLDLKLECDNKYTRIDKKYFILEKLAIYCLKRNVSLAVRGECYGEGLNASGINPHCKLPLDFRAFNILNLDTRTYESWDKCEEVCAIIGVSVVPTLERKILLTPELIKKYREDLEKIDGQPFEGVVIKGNGFSFKVLSKLYDSKK